VLGGTSWQGIVEDYINEKFYDLYVSQFIKSGSVGWAGHVERIVEKRGACRVLVVKPEGKEELGRRRCIWEGNIKMDLQ